MDVELDIDELKRDLCMLMEKHKCSLGVDIDGDTYGISTNFIVEDSKGKSHVLMHYQSYIDCSDLKD